jgi:DNA-binding protein WhiA
MSFSSDVKNELSRVNIDKKCCTLAQIAGLIRVCGSVKIFGGGKLELKISTENAAIARLFLKRIKSYFGVGANLQIAQRPIQRKGHVYELSIGYEDNAEQILRETGVLGVKEGCNYFPDDIPSDLIKTKCCRKCYLQGVF